MIAVGGEALLGAPARNAAGVAAVANPAHYAGLVDELRQFGGLSAELRARLAAEAFGIVAAYYAEIAAYLNQIGGTVFPSRLALVLEKVGDLRYGENPHQRAAFYRETTHRSGTVADARQLQGGAPSFNNLLDLDAAYRTAADYAAPTVVITKHTDPVGLASADELVEAYRRALETDAVAAFGGIVGINRELDRVTAEEIAANSYEAVIAPSFSEDALAVLHGKTGLELLAVPPDPTEGMRDYGIANLDFKRVGGGLLVESLDTLGLDKGQLQVVTRRRPTLEELTDLLFAWRAVRHVRSNAIVLAKNAATVGIGAAQASRSVSVEIALRRAGDRAKLAVMASDAYFPFPDGIALAAQAGVTAIIQPGGSIRDEMAIEVADRHHVAMVFTGRRHFRH
jgi:phosphoribosylaminoimidazolecarboxamide formyltransferase/IMP cyclohydrolase